MSTRAEIVEAGRALLGTPFHHEGRVPGVGLDCVGVPIKISHALDISDFDIQGYPQQPDGAMFRRLCEENLDSIGFEDLRLADLLTFMFEAEQHIALVTMVEPIYILHSYRNAGKVVEHRLDRFWEKKIRGCWRFRGVTD